MFYYCATTITGYCPTKLWSSSLLFSHNVSSNWNQTLELRIWIILFYHCATTITGYCLIKLFSLSPLFSASARNSCNQTLELSIRIILFYYWAITITSYCHTKLFSPSSLLSPNCHQQQESNPRTYIFGNLTPFSMQGCISHKQQVIKSSFN